MNKRIRRVERLKAQQIWSEYGLKWNKSHNHLVLRKGASKDKIIAKMNQSR